MELVKKKVTVTHWQAELVGSEQTYQTGQATDLHLFLEDEAGEPIEDADVAVTLDRPVTVHQINKVMHHVEGGLYVAEAVFSLPGTWVVMVEATQGDKQYKNEYLIEVEGRSSLKKAAIRMTYSSWSKSYLIKLEKRSSV